MRLPMLRQRVQTMVDHHNIASTGQADSYPVAFFLRGEADEVLGGLLGEIWAGWLHVKTLAVAAPAQGQGFGRELMKRAEAYVRERGPSMKNSAIGSLASGESSGMATSISL